MKEIKKEKIIEEIVGYVAEDGTEFTSKEECLQYEKTAKAVIKSRFYKMIIRKMEVCKITGDGSIPLSECGDGWWVGLVKISSKEDVDAANMYCEYLKVNKRFTDDMIGKEILVSLCDNDWCYPYGTIDDAVNQYREALMKITKEEEEKDGV